MELVNTFKITANNKTAQARASKGLEVGDTIRVTTDISGEFRKPLVISKYKGVGDLNDAESFEYVGKAQSNTFHNNFSTGDEAAFTVVEVR